MIRSTDLIERLRRERPDTMAEIARIREAQRERGWKLIRLDVDDDTLAARRARRDAEGWAPKDREREVSTALKIFGMLAQSADKGAARKLD